MSLTLLVPLSLIVAQAQAADARTTFLVRQLQRGADPRTRIQAAIMLGARGDAIAVPVLCKTLEDPEDAVRLAVARALAQLPTAEALTCLRKVKDSSAAIRAVVDRALVTGGSKRSLYVHLDPVVDQTIGSNPALKNLLERELARTLVQHGATLAPPSETRVQALAAEKAKGLRGFTLLPEIKSIPGGLQLTLIGSSYPDRALLGEVNVRGTGAAPEELIRALVARAISEAAQTFDWSQR